MALNLALEEMPSPSSTQSADDFELVSHLNRLFYDARRLKSDRYNNWTRNYSLLCSRYGGSNAQAWSPNPKDSEIYPILGAMVAWMTDQNVIIDASPAADPNSDFYEFMADLSNNLSDLLYSNWVVLDYQSQIKLVLWDSFLYGLGIFKSVWDNALDNGYGNAILRRVNPWHFYQDPNATNMLDAEYFVEVHRMSYDEICRRFPDAAQALANSEGGNETYDQPPTMYADSSTVPMAPNLGNLPSTGTIWGGRQNMSQSKYGSPNASQYFTVYEYWLRENEEWEDDYSDLVHESDADPSVDRPEPALSDRHVEDKWRVVVVAKGAVLLNELAEDLWSHKQHPYERYVFDDIGEFYGIALVDHLAQPQIYINRLLTSMQQNAELIGNPIFMESAQSGLGRTSIINKPGQRLRLQGGPGAMANPPSWLHPPEMPSFIMELVNFWISRMENISGLSAIVRGATPTNRNAEGVISSIQEAAFVRIRSGLSNLEKSLERSGVKLCDLIIDNFTDPRICAIVGPSGEQTALALQSRHFYGPTENGAAPLKYSLLIRAGASMATSRQARIAENDTLYAMGVVDRQAVLEAHQYPNYQTVLKRVAAETAQGTFNPPGARQRAGRTS